jgi:hypothetical protein
MSKIFSKFKRTTIDELVGSLNERVITSVGIQNGGTNWAPGDVVQIAGGTVLKINEVSSNVVTSINVVASGTYSNLTALSNVSVYNVANAVANSTYGGRETVAGANLRINVVFDTNAPKKNRFYFVASGTTQYDTIQTEKETEFDSFLNIWDETLFGRVADIIPVARRVNWQLNQTYYPYDDKDPDIRTKNYFVINGGHVFKCIDNGANSSVSSPLSIVPPAYNESTTPKGTPFSVGDGYIWIHMGSLNSEIDNLFGTNSYFPVQEYANTKNAAVDGGLFSIKVNAGGTEYLTINGVTAAPLGDNVTNRVAIAGAVANPSYYENCGIYIVDNNDSYVKKINSLTVNSSNPLNIFTEVQLAEGENFPAEFLKLGQQYTIAPYVEIKSKTGSGAAAYSVVANDGSINKIVMANYGSGYKDATITIRNAPEIGTGAELIGIISPSGGHCSNIFDELYVDSVSISSKFDGSNFPLEPKYNTVALLKNPTYAKDLPPLAEKTFNANTALIKDNTFNAQTGVDGTDDFITTTSAHGLANGNKVQYLVAAGNTAVSPLVNATSYFVVSANTTAVKLATAPGGSALNLTAGSSETGHTLRRVGQGYITITSNNLRTGDGVVYDVKAGNTAISPLVSGKTYYVASSNSTTISLSEISGGSAIVLVPGISETGHGLTRTAATEDSPFYGPTFVQTISIPIASKVGDLIEGEFVDSNTLEIVNGIGEYPSGKVAFSNNTLLQLTGVDGNFVPGSIITGRTSGDYVVAAAQPEWDAYFTTSTPKVGANDYIVKLYSGEILYAKNVELVERSDQSEIIKIIVKF